MPTIKVTNLATNRVVSVQSQTDGTYVVSALPIGNYKVEAARQAFKAESVTLSLQISEVKELGFSLHVGSGTETVQVTSASPLVDTESSSAGEVIEGRQIVDLPSTAATSPRWALLTRRQPWPDSDSERSAKQCETWRNGIRRRGPGRSTVCPSVRQFHARWHLTITSPLVNTIVIFPAIEDIRRVQNHHQHSSG